MALIRQPHVRGRNETVRSGGWTSQHWGNPAGGLAFSGTPIDDDLSVMLTHPWPGPLAPGPAALSLLVIGGILLLRRALWSHQGGFVRFQHVPLIIRFPPISPSPAPRSLRLCGQFAFVAPRIRRLLSALRPGYHGLAVLGGALAVP